MMKMTTDSYNNQPTLPLTQHLIMIPSFFKVLVLSLAPLLLKAQAFTLEEAVSYAMENAVEVRDKNLQIARADKDIKEFLSTGLPQINGSANYQYFIDIPVQLVPIFPEQQTTLVQDIDGDLVPLTYTVTDDMGNPVFGPPQEFRFGLRNNLTAQISIEALLFDGTFFTGLQASKLYKELVQREMAQTRSSLALNVRKAYLAVLAAEKNKDILASNITNLEKSLSETEAIYQEGFAEQLDVDRLTLSLRNLKTEEQAVSRTITTLRNLLKFRMGYPLDEGIELTDNLDGLAARTVFEDIAIEDPFDVSQRPEYRVLDQAEKLNLVDIRRHQVGYLPALNAFGSYARVLQANDLADARWFPTTVVGLSLKVPVFDGFGKEARIQKARIDLERTQLQRSNFSRSAKLEVINARITYLNALETLRAREETVDLAEQIYRTTQIKYREGVGSSLELNQAESDLYVSQGNYIQSLYELLIAQIDLDKALGNF